MPIWIRVGRWGVAAPVAFLGLVLGMVGVTALWRKFGGDAGTAFTWGIGTGTVLAALLGAVAAPPGQRKLASKLVVGAIFGLALISLLVDLVSRSFHITDIYAIVGSVLGGGIAIRAVHRSSLGPSA